MDIATTVLADIIRAYGPIPTVRVSSAQSHTSYPYWGAVRYQLRLTRDGYAANIAMERASSDRRSQRLAERDAAEIAEREGRIELYTIGTVSPDTAAGVVDELIDIHPHARAIRRRKNRALAELRATPQWIERAAADVLSVPMPWLSESEQATVRARAGEIEALRKQRAAARYISERRELTRRVLYHGIPILIHGQRWSWKQGGQVRYRPDDERIRDSYRSRREAAQAYLRARVRRYGELELSRSGREWVLLDRSTYRSTRYTSRPQRAELVAAIIRHGNAQAVQHG